MMPAPHEMVVGKYRRHRTAGCASETDMEDEPFPLLSRIGEERRAFADEVSGPSHKDGMSHIHQPMMVSLTAQDRVCN